MSDTIDRILSGLQSGLPVLLLHFLITLILLGIGILCYMAITPFGEGKLVRQGNAAAGAVLAGAIVALAIPLAATLATSASAIDTLFWGLVALILQLLVFGIVSLLLSGLKSMVEAGNVAVALTLAGIQIAVALLNAGMMSG